MDSTPRADDLLKEMVLLEQSLEEKRKERAELIPKIKEAQKIRDDNKAVYELAQKQYWDAEQEFNRKERTLRGIDADGRLAKDELARLKREYNRLRDAEKINEKYNQQVAAFKEKCLDSPWRKENRTDGLGALDYQIDGAVHLALTERTLLGDTRGLGKTLTTLIACDLRESRKIIAVVPADVVENFIREIGKWAPHRSPINLYGASRGQRDMLLRAIKKAPEFIVVVNYEAWRTDDHLIKDLIALQADTLICDEAHKGKTVKSIQGKGLQQIRYGVNTCPDCLLPDVEYDGLKKPEDSYKCWCGYEGPVEDFCSIKTVIPMSGTFILNRPQELYPMLRLVDIKNFPEEKLYLRDFCKKDNGVWKWNYSGEKALMKKIGPRYLARKRSDVGIQIPDPQPIDHVIPLSELEKFYPNQHEAYKQIRDFMELAFTEDSTMKMPDVIVRLMRMRQALVWPAAINFQERDKNGLVKRRLSLDVHESWKIDKAEELIRDFNEEGERVVVFSEFKSGISELQRRLGARTAIYDGDVDKRQRTAIQLDFDIATAPDHPRWDNVVCSYSTAGVGLNFNSATHMILIDRTWNPGRESQAIGRMDRLGQTKNTYVHNLIVSGKTVDAWMAKLIDSKANLIAGFDDEATQWKLAYEALRNGEM